MRYIGHVDAWERMRDGRHLFSCHVMDVTGKPCYFCVTGDAACEGLDARRIGFRVAYCKELGEAIEQCIRDFIQSPDTPDIFGEITHWSENPELWENDFFFVGTRARVRPKAKALENEVQGGRETNQTALLHLVPRGGRTSADDRPDGPPYGP